MTLHIRLGKFDSKNARDSAIKYALRNNNEHEGKIVIHADLSFKGKLKVIYDWIEKMTILSVFGLLAFLMFVAMVLFIISKFGGCIGC